MRTNDFASAMLAILLEAGRPVRAQARRGRLLDPCNFGQGRIAAVGNRLIVALCYGNVTLASPLLSNSQSAFHPLNQLL